MPERMTLSKSIQMTIMRTVDYLIAKAPIQGYSLAVLYPLTLLMGGRGREESPIPHPYLGNVL